MRKEKVPEIVEKSRKKLPSLPDGRIDYKKANRVPIIASFLKHGDEIAIFRRSDKVGTHQSMWGTITGYFDEAIPSVEKALKEMKEESGIGREKISSTREGDPYEFEGEGKVWVVHPVLFELEKKPKIHLNWEHTEYRWIDFEKVGEHIPVKYIPKEFVGKRE